VSSFLPWIIPPLAGALIGYITNAIAIIMLFRPLKEIRILGMRLPFTPGILPRERHKLADSIGRMVERELLTAEILSQRLSKSDVRKALEAALAEYTESVLLKPFSEWDDKIPSLITRGAQNLYPGAAAVLISFLKRDDVRKNLEEQGRFLLSGAMLRLNVFQRFFVSAVNFEQTLAEKMSEIITDLIGKADTLLQSGETKKNALLLLQTELELAFKKGRIPAESGSCIQNTFNLNNENREAFNNFIAEKIIDAANARLGSLLELVNVRTLVSDRIDALDMLKVEGIVLDVLAGKLKWINIFGAFLGALIGLLEVLISRYL
jgi:uncharacterized membrane protein YheB (UPF0754 family)